MPQLIAIGLIGGVVWLGWRALKREMARINAETRAAENRNQDVTHLRKGEDGVYRVEKDKED